MMKAKTLFWAILSALIIQVGCGKSADVPLLKKDKKQAKVKKEQAVEQQVDVGAVKVDESKPSNVEEGNKLDVANVTVKEGITSFVSSAAAEAYVAPGSYDEFYWFMSGGYSGQVSVYGIPSGRLFKVIPVFSLFPENGYGFEEETKDMLLTSYGHIPWDDSHHPKVSMTNGEQDGRWLFINGNNTPRIARIDLKSFETTQIIEIPNSAGNHGSPFLTENTEYLMASTRFAIPILQSKVTIQDAAKGLFKGTISLVSVDKNTGDMNLKGQVLVPGYDYDIAHCGKGPSHDWCFFTSYNTEQAYEMLESNAVQNEKDYILAFNWVGAQKCFDEGKGKNVPATYYRNTHPENKPTVSEKFTKVKLLDPKDCPGIMYYLPTPKNPHGCDVDPTGEYIVAGGKLSGTIPVHSFSKFMKAKDNEGSREGAFGGIPVLKYEATLAAEIDKPCLGPLHTEFDGKGFGYTSCFVSSEVVKWHLGTWQVVDRVPSYYSIGHLSISGGDSTKPNPKYLIALNKITKDRYLPVGAEVSHSAQLFLLTGDKMKLILDFPTIGEPHYAQGVPASLLKENTQRIYRLDHNAHPYAAKQESEAKVVRSKNVVHVNMTAIRSHFKPDIVEVKTGDVVYFHVTNLEQDYDIPHGFAIKGSKNSGVLIMPGQTKTVKWVAEKAGVYPFYCSDFCSAMHQEMQQYILVK